MKKTTLIACLLLIALVLTACASDDIGGDASESGSENSVITNDDGTTQTVQLSTDKKANYKIIISRIGFKCKICSTCIL